jgi:hypothetical protein
VPVTQEPFQENLLALCPICDEENERCLKWKRLPRSVGFLWPDALLYNENDAADPEIMSTFREDLRQGIDAVIIVGFGNDHRG